MTEQLITLVYEKLEKFSDPISKKALNNNNNDLNIVCKDGHANISLAIDPKEQNKYNDLSISLNHALKEINAVALASTRRPDQVVQILKYVTSK